MWGTGSEFDKIEEIENLPEEIHDILLPEEKTIWISEVSFNKRLKSNEGIFATIFLVVFSIFPIITFIIFALAWGILSGAAIATFVFEIFSFVGSCVLYYNTLGGDFYHVITNRRFIKCQITSTWRKFSIYPWSCGIAVSQVVEGKIKLAPLFTEGSSYSHLLFTGSKTTELDLAIRSLISKVALPEATRVDVHNLMRLAQTHSSWPSYLKNPLLNADSEPLIDQSAPNTNTREILWSYKPNRFQLWKRVLIIGSAVIGLFLILGIILTAKLHSMHASIAFALLLSLGGLLSLIILIAKDGFNAGYVLTLSGLVWITQNWKTTFWKDGIVESYGWEYVYPLEMTVDLNGNGSMYFNKIPVKRMVDVAGVMTVEGLMEEIFNPNPIYV